MFLFFNYQVSPNRWKTMIQNKSVKIIGWNELFKWSIYTAIAFGFFFGFLSLSYAQSIRVTADASASTREQYGISTDTEQRFFLDQGNFYSTLSSTPMYRGVKVVRISDGRTKIGLLRVGEQIERVILDDQGQVLSTSSTPLYGNDPSLEIYTWDDGRSVVRENISNFMFFDAGGTFIFPVSNAARSRYGETNSELVSDPSGETVVIYNPSIRRAGGSFSSRATLVNWTSRSLSSFYGGPETQIYHVSVSRSGSFITITANNGDAGSKVLVFDRYGSLLAEQAVDFEARFASFLPESRHVIAYSSSRVAVYEFDSWERIASSSIRNTILVADYFPIEGLILILTGEKGDNRVMNAEFVAVDVKQRKIAREPLGRNFLQTQVQLSFERVSEGSNHSFLLNGAGISIMLHPSF